MQSPVNMANGHILKSQTVKSLIMCDSRKYPYPSHGWFFRLDPPHPLRISVPEGLCITPIPPGISYVPFHGLNLPYLEIIDCVPLKINCSHLKTQFFIIFDLFVIFYKAIMYFLRRQSTLDRSDYEKSLFFISPSSETHKARKQRLISLYDLKKTFRT